MTIYHTLLSTIFYLKLGVTTTKWAKGKRIRLKTDKTSSNKQLRNHFGPELCSSNSKHSSHRNNQSITSICFYLTALNSPSKSRILRSIKKKKKEKKVKISIYVCELSVFDVRSPGEE